MNDYFKTRVVVTEAGCWEWTGYRRKWGYGQTGLHRPEGGQWSAHRLSYTMHVGPIPDGMTVDHMCYNPPCCRPDHLRLLTRSDNAAAQRAAFATHCRRGHELTPENTRIKDYGNGKRDCKACHRDRERRRQRAAAAANPGPGTPRGERSRKSSLTADDVQDIRRRRAAGESASALAREYRVSRPTVQDIVARRTWQHLLFIPYHLEDAL